MKGIAVYTREKWDTPMSELKKLSLADMTAMRAEAEEKAKVLYARIAKMTKKEKIEAGAMVYTAGFVLPVARASGAYDDLVKNHGFFEIHPAVAASYNTIISGVATEMIPRLFLTGSWGNPVPEGADAVESKPADEFSVLHALMIRGVAALEGVAESTGLAAERVKAAVEQAIAKGHAKQMTGRVSGVSLTPSGRARHIVARGGAVTKAAIEGLTPVYQAFLHPNRSFKAVTTDWQLRAQKKLDEASVKSRLDEVHAQVSGVVKSAAAIDPRFGRYQQRLDTALASFKAGNADALEKPLSGS